RSMIAFARRDSIKTGAVDLDRVFMVGNRAVFAGAEINDSLLFIDRINRPDIPVTTGNLVDEFAIRAAVINATPAAAIAQPKKRSILQPSQAFIDCLDPGVGFFPQEAR